MPTIIDIFDEWNLFKSAFNTLINDNLYLSKHEVFQYRRRTLMDNPKLEKHMIIIASILRLHQRHEIKRIIVNCHFKCIYNMQSIKHEYGNFLVYKTIKRKIF